MPSKVEPWLRNTHLDLDSLRRQVVHALELTREDCARWCEPLSAAELFARPLELPSVAFQMLHIGRSLDRLLRYAEGGQLTQAQHDALNSEGDPMEREAVFREFADALERSVERILLFKPGSYEQAAHVGRDRLPTTVGALLIHCAEHTQRHSGQMVTTAKVVAATRTAAGSSGQAT